ncbi:SulP family inorganic anion transporter [Limibaculum sp. M0105]|uniref:SulP family inorganic anion transporter n=1 Tax=Thermohalobaculum xanthum TaxID=2753746 RepID=A0A8J7M8B7_9RHOB|nr:SulP family inorganic anion transporter [Thermohalobaculum xanthum]MBK0399615.1 SulP family inorganic anion transporter [Thermohalobaculum xanthum]
MATDATRPAPGAGGQFVGLFTPKLVTVLSEGYGLRQLRADALAGLTVAIVALPLSMAIAIASGATPAMGLYTAIIGGFLVSALGGSRYQIGGPAGAFIVLVAATVAREGIDGLILATFMAGIILVAAGFLRIGTYIKFIPYPVTVGFTAGIAAIIFASQISGLLGLTLDGPEPGPLIEKISALWAALPSFNGWSVALAAGTAALILGLRHVNSRLPGMLIAVTAAGVATALFALPVDTIGTRFGGIPSGLPLPALPDLSLAKVEAVLPDAIAFALLGAIESLLSAVVADGMSGRRHRSNCELVAQGAANMGSALFGGFCVTGTIARTATNVRAGAHGPVSGMLHSAFLLAFMLIAAPLAAYIPLAALAAVLAVVSWQMVERHAIGILMRASRGDALVLSVTFLLTVFRDLTEAIVVGFALGSVIFIHRMSGSTVVEAGTPMVPEDRADDSYARHGLPEVPGVVLYKVRGVLFFGAASAIEGVLDRIGSQHKALVLDLSRVPFLDSTGANTIGGLVAKARTRGVRIAISGALDPVRRDLATHGIAAPQVILVPTIPAAIEALEAEGVIAAPAPG